MLKTFLRNCRCPEGRLGRLVVLGMNRGHAQVSSWALKQANWPDGLHILDVGCGGGGNIARLLKQYPHSTVDGVDYSAQSVAVSQKVNASHLNTRCRIIQGDVSALPFSADIYDAVTAMETVYFWPDLKGGFGEIRRVLKPGGTLLVVCELGDPVKGRLWSRRCPGMTIYTGEELQCAMAQAGYDAVTLYQRGAWIAVSGRKSFV